jgi:hypothetical protein
MNFFFFRHKKKKRKIFQVKGEKIKKRKSIVWMKKKKILCLFLGFLFLGSLFLSGLLLLADDALTHEADGGEVLLEELVGGLLSLGLGDLAGGGSSGADGGGVGGGLAEARAVLLDGLLLFGGGVSLGRGLLGDGEDDELGEVGLEALGVEVEGLLGDVLAASIDGDADGGDVAGSGAGGLDLGGGEAAAEALAHVVADGGAGDGRLELLQGAGEDLLGLLEAETAAGLGLLGLGEEGLVVTLLGRAGGPVLTLVDLRDRVVTLDHSEFVLFGFEKEGFVFFFVR